MASPPTAYVHVIKKSDLTSHTSVPLTEPAASQPPLQGGSVRAKTAIVALTYNNVTYAQLGDFLHWWKTYPVPQSLSSSYNDPTIWGIVPCWGYGEVLESKVQGISAGQLLWGFWPVSGHAVDLKLVPADVPGHWIEISEHRAPLGNLYQRYRLRDPAVRSTGLNQADRERMGADAAYLVWEAGYLQNEYVHAEPYIHPAGAAAPPGQMWTAEEGGLSSAVVVSLSAGGKTGRAFADQLAHERKPGTGPKGLLCVTGNPNKLPELKAGFPVRAISYADVGAPATLEWIQSCKAEKIVIADYGSREGSYPRLRQALQTALPTIPIITLILASEWDSTSQNGGDMGALLQQPKVYLMNAGVVQDEGMKSKGAGVFFDELAEAWKRFVERGNLKATKWTWGESVHGETGMEGGWERLIKGNVGGDEALVYSLQ